MTAETNHSTAPAAGKRARISNETLLQGETDPLTDRAVHLLQLDGVGKHYGNIIALRDVTMAVDNGRVTCVLGDNGAGKSTLIKIIAGLHQHDAGVLKLSLIHI